MNRTLKLTVEYDGSELVGWQRQASGTSVQGLLEDALAAFEGGPVVVHGAGRTDAGVHALAQVASVPSRRHTRRTPFSAD
jgi:tRNA pseudouridine38-40 synthase